MLPRQSLRSLFRRLQSWTKAFETSATECHIHDPSPPLSAQCCLPVSTMSLAVCSETTLRGGGGRIYIDKTDKMLRHCLNILSKIVDRPSRQKWEPDDRNDHHNMTAHHHIMGKPPKRLRSLCESHRPGSRHSGFPGPPALTPAPSSCAPMPVFALSLPPESKLEEDMETEFSYLDCPFFLLNCDYKVKRYVGRIEDCNHCIQRTPRKYVFFCAVTSILISGLLNKMTDSRSVFIGRIHACWTSKTRYFQIRF